MAKTIRMTFLPENFADGISFVSSASVLMLSSQKAEKGFSLTIVSTNVTLLSDIGLPQKQKEISLYLLTANKSVRHGMSGSEGITEEGRYRSILHLQGVHLILCFFEDFKIYIPDSGLSRFPLGVSVCTQWQVKHQRCSRTCRVQKKITTF